MEEGAQIKIKQYLRYEPQPITKVVIVEGSVTKGDYIPPLGQVEKVKDDGTETEEGEAREKPYILATRVTNENYADLSPHLQFKLLLQASDRVQKLTRALYNKHGIDDTLEDKKDDDRDDNPLQRFYKEYGMGKVFAKLNG